ncbi:YkuS family protein [Salinicoccus bachuensis]|uniref:YkuS family protein n=1 Tax=Salinicoccus bachuensis TaxID=3136731 RepID=A0ABZ3CIF0_9STAP
MTRIAVEQPFTDVRQALKKKGYQADMIHQTTNPGAYDALVVRDRTVFGDSRVTGSLIETSGLSISEIVEEVEERLQRAGKIPGTADAEKSGSVCGFATGILTGTLLGGAAALLLAPKSGKEMQNTLKEKLPSGNSNKNSSGKLSQVKEKATDLTGQLQEKAETAKNQVREEISSAKDQQGTDTDNEKGTGSSQEENDNSKNE